MRHASVEVLSSYLDGELADGRRLRVERHLQECEQCQHGLEGLRRVVQRLDGMGRISPESSLEQQVLQGVAGSARRESLLDRLERGAKRLHVERWVWMPTFGIVMALVSIMYLVSWGLHRQQQGLPVVLDAEFPPAEASEEAEAVVSEEVPPLAEGLRAMSPQPRREDVRLSDTTSLGVVAHASEIGGRLFERQDGIWIEEGVDPAAPSISLDPAVAASPQWQEQLPGLAELERLGGPVRLRVGDQLVQLEFDRRP
jgi:hypothetical protein